MTHEEKVAFLDKLCEPDDLDEVEFITQEQAQKQAIEEINNYASQTWQPIKTRWPIFNEHLNGGLFWNEINVLMARSGGGKTAFLSQIKDDALNPDLNNQHLRVLIHSLELTANQMEQRAISSKAQATIGQLRKKGVSSVAKADKRLLYVERSGTAQQIERMIYRACINWGIKPYVKLHGGRLVKDDTPRHSNDVGMLYGLDHTLLARKDSRQTEMDMLGELMRVCMRVNQRFKIVIIDLSQMNRNILSDYRMQHNAPKGAASKQWQYPQESDLRGSDEMLYGTYNLFALHNPEKLGIRSYGPSDAETKRRIFLHILKQRNGGLGIYELENKLAQGRLDFLSSLK